MKGQVIIRIHGHLDTTWKDWFEGMAISYEGPDTMLSGIIKDESHLHGILNKIRDLNLPLQSVSRMENSHKNTNETHNS